MRFTASSEYKSNYHTVCIGGFVIGITSITAAVFVCVAPLSIHNIPFESRPAAAVMLGCIGVFLTVGSIWQSRNPPAEIETDQEGVSVITRRGRDKLAWESIERIKWLPHNAALIAIARDKALRLPLAPYSRADRIFVVRDIRRRAIYSIQENWPLFCHRFAYRWLEREFLGDKRPLHEDEFRTSRGRLDCIFAGGTIVSGLVSLISWRYTGESVVLFGPGAILPIWIAMRYRFPKEGLVGNRLTLKNDYGRAVIFYAVWLPVFILVIAWIPRGNTALLLLFTVATSGTLMFGAVLVDRRRMRRESALADETVKEWDMLEAKYSA
jgi:hypothetical protein